MIRNRGVNFSIVLLVLGLVLCPRVFAQQYKSAPDWKVEVVAEAPKLLYPTAISVAPDGRIFVGEDTIDMGGPADQPIDRVVCVHPDGRITVFATNLGCVFGLQYLDGKLFVNHAPKCSVFTDRDSIGVDRVDLFDYTNPRQLLVGAITHIPGNIRWAMDGFLYMAVGDTGIYNAVGKDGRKISMRAGGILRFRPDGTEMEIYAVGTRNHPDVALNAEDEMFTYDNTDDGQGWWTRVAHMVDGGNYGYPWDYRPQQPYILWMMGDYGAGSGTASFAYNEDGLPPEYQGNLFLGDYARSQLMRLRVARDGGTYKIVSRETPNNVDFLASGTTDFRPIGVAASLDGAGLYVTDWNTYMCWVQGVKAGRLLKLTYQGKSRAMPRPDWLAAAGTGKSFSASPADLITALKHPAQSVRLIAQRRLSAGGAKNAPLLIELLRDKSAPPPARWGAIWALDGIDQGQAGRQAIVAALQDSEPSVKRQAARQLGTRRVSSAASALIPLLKDSEASVRFHAATALGRSGAVESIGQLIEGLVEKDSFARYAVFTALNRIGQMKPEAWPQIVAGLSSSNNAIREGIFFALRETYSAPLVPALSNFVFNTTHSLDLRLKLMAMLGEMTRQPPEWNGDWWGATGGLAPVNRPRPSKTRDWEGTPAASAALRRGLKDTEPAIRTAAFAAVQKCNDIGILTELIQDEKNAEFFPAMQTLATLKAESAIPALAKYMDSANANVRQAAFNALVGIGGDKAAEVLSSKVNQPASPARLEAIGALGRLRRPAAVPALIAAFQDATCRNAALQALAEIPDLRAIDIYSQGLRSPDAAERDRCLRAVAAIQAEALPLLEKKMEQTPFPPQVVESLRQLRGGTSLTGWYVIGPAKAENVEKLLTASEIPVNAPFVDSMGRSFSWQRPPAKPLTGRTDMSALADKSKDSSEPYVYAAIALSVAANMDAQLRAEADDSLVLWWNGTKVLDYSGGGKPAPSVPVKITGGRNRVLARLGKTSTEFGSFSVRLFPAAPAVAKPVDGSKPATPKSLHLAWALHNDGNPEGGRRLFSAGGCANCHRINGEGESIGPDLSSIGSKYNREQMIDSLLYPSKQVLVGYQQTMIITKDDEVQTGVIRKEDDQEVVLLDSASQSHTIKTSEIKERRRSDLSLMPDGLFETWSREEFGDLVTYLASLKNQSTNR